MFTYFFLSPKFIILGDKVLASSPWEKTACQEGIIHKILGDRVLLKFSKSFHDTYRNEDYKIEFHFSRGSFIKQHNAVEKVMKNLGTGFLFPIKVNTNSCPQVNVQMHNQDLLRDGTKVPWFNPQLNIVQKKAVENILLGVARPTPYVIFGPPGNYYNKNYYYCFAKYTYTDTNYSFSVSDNCLVYEISHTLVSHQNRLVRLMKPLWLLCCTSG